MFSPNVQSDVRETVAMQKFESIRDICIALNKEANKQDFFDKAKDQIESNVNQFVEAFAFENGMHTRTVQPLKWSFSISDQKLFDDGLIELIYNYDKHPCFSYIEVLESKITVPLALVKASESEIDNKTDLQIDQVQTYEAWLMKLNQQIEVWDVDLKYLRDNNKEGLELNLKALELTLAQLKSHSRKVSKEFMRDVEKQKNAFQATMEKVKRSFNKHS